MLGRIIADAINEQLAPLRRRIESLEARNDGELRYCGVWQDQKYERGNFVTLNGGLGMRKWLRHRGLTRHGGSPLRVADHDAAN
jgi:hypothetical protein